MLIVKMAPGRSLDEALKTLIKRKLHDEASPRHAPAAIVEAPDLPHTRSGKLVELAVREALANPESLRFFARLAALATYRKSGRALLKPLIAPQI